MSEDKSSALYDDIVTVNSVDPALYDMYPVKRGLRNNDGSGVIAGITNISNVHGYMMNEGDKVPVEGKLTFRGYDIYDLLSDTSPSKRYGFEEVAYLLMLGKLPTQDELDQFVAAIDAERELPDGFTAARIMRHPAADLMIMLSRSIISLYADDPNAEDRSIEHEIKTAISLISRLQRIMVLSYHAKQAYFHGDSMIMHRFVPGQSSSETILSMLRPDRAFTPEEARTHPQRSVITRALGSDAHLHPDIYEINVETGDRLLICSDGLSGMIFDDQIENTLRRVQDPQRCASQLVNEAIAAGGHDNVTVIVADVTGYAEVRRKKLARKTKLSIALVLVLFAAIVAGAAWGTQTYLNTAAYLANDNGKVAVYRGVPGSVLGLSFSHLERTTDVTVADLQPGVANRLNEGIRVDDMEAADALVKEYEDEIAARSKNQAEGGNAESGRNADAKDASDAKNGGAA